MDNILKEEDFSIPQVALYATISFFVVSLLGVFIYITCSRKYKLNWFEKNLLETANEHQELNESQEALVCSSIPYNIDTHDTMSIHSMNKSIGSNDDPTFWVPPIQRQTSDCNIQSADESLVETPTSPTGSHNSMALSIGGSVPIARTDKHVVLAMSPARPKVSSMQAKLDHTKIDTSLYDNQPQPRKPSIPENARGAIHLTIGYDPNAGILTVRLVEAQDLQPRDFSGTADPYAKIRLLPDKSNVWQTRIHKRTLNPVFDEDFVFEERPAVIGRRTIEILLYDFDAYSRHVCIGGTQIPLAQLDLSKKVVLWNPLTSCAEQDAKMELGDLMVSMSFLPSAERLTVVLIKARNLRVVDDSRNSSDPYVKVSVLHNGKKIKKRKTGVYRSTVCPVFNEALTFDISKDILKNCLIEFLVLHDSLLGSNEVLGRAIVGSSSDVQPEQRDFFEEILRTKTATAQWIPLCDPSAQ
ncbi:hypothetical protein HA402_001287 [Bradysia odoriphaga]|nr:hypothetical protein HA402_001287 [Bradysia odoriphaga]